MAHEDKGRLEVEDRGAVLIVRVDGGPHGLFGLDIANQLEELVDRADRDPSVHAVVLTGAHPERFVSHADVRWLQEEGAAAPRSAGAAPPSSHAWPDARARRSRGLIASLRPRALIPVSFVRGGNNGRMPISVFLQVKTPLL